MQALLFAVTSFSIGIEALAATAQLPVHYAVVDRGPSLVRTLVNTPGLNGRGDLAIWHVVGPSVLEGILYHGKQVMHIPGGAEYSFVYPADLNDALVVVGTVQKPQDLRLTHAFKWSNGSFNMLGSLGGAYAAATSINTVGEVVGNAQTASGSRHAVLWRGTKPRDLGLLLRGDYSSAKDINDRSEVVGEANLSPNAKPSAFFWRAGQMRKLPNLPGGSFCTAQALNDQGDVVGSCDLANGSGHGVIWRKGRVQDLGTLGDDDDSPSTALDINVRGQVVGSAEVSEGKLRAFLWQSSKMINLNEAIMPHSGWLLMVASRINDRGEIAGRGFYHGTIHAFLLRPEPASSGLVHPATEVNRERFSATK